MPARPAVRSEFLRAEEREGPPLGFFRDPVPADARALLVMSKGVIGSRAAPPQRHDLPPLDFEFFREPLAAERAGGRFAIWRDAAVESFISRGGEECRNISRRGGVTFIAMWGD